MVYLALHVFKFVGMETKI